MEKSHGFVDFKAAICLVITWLMTMVCFSSSGFAQCPGGASSQTYLDAFSMTPLTDGNETDLKSIAACANDFVKSHAGEGDSDAGRELKAAIAKAKNYYEMKKKFGDCHADSDLKLDSRIEQIAVTLSPSTFGCETKIDPFHDIFESVRYSNMQDKIVANSMLNALNKYYDVEMRYGNRDASGIVSKLCAGGCSSQVRDQMQKRLAALAQNPPPKADPTKVIYGLSLSLNDIDKNYLWKVQVNPEHKVSAILDATTKPLNALNMEHPNITDADRKTFDQYANAYMALLSSPDGSLLNTDVMRECTGSYRDLDHDLELDFPVATNYHLEPYRTVSQCVKQVKDKMGLLKYGDGTDVFNAAVAEMKKSIEDETTHLGKMEAKKFSQEKGDPIHHARAAKKSLPDLEELVEADPVAIAQYLLDHPDETTDICKIIKQAEVDRKNSAHTRKMFLYSAGVVMGVAAVASGGSAAALWVFSGAAAGGAATTVATITAIGAWGGVTAAGAGVVYTGTRIDEAVVASEEATLLQNGFFSGNTDLQGEINAQKAVTEYYTLQNEAIVSGLLTPLDIKALIDGYGVLKGMDAMKSAAAAKDLAFKMSEVNRINSDGELAQCLQRMRDPAVEGAANTSKVLKILFGEWTPEDLRIKLLMAMKNWNGEKLKALAEAALKGSAQCQ